MLWDKSLHCGTLLSDRRLKSLFLDGLLPSTCKRVRLYLATHRRADYQTVVNPAHALGEVYRTARRTVSNVAKSYPLRKETQLQSRDRPVKGLKIEIPSQEDSHTSTENSGDLKLLALTSGGRTENSEPTYSTPPSIFNHPYLRRLEQCSR